MKRGRRAAALLAAVLAAAPGISQGETVFAYSQTESTYGACYGCGPDALDRAMDECRAAGGTDCRPVLSCANGWAATAFPAEGGPFGIGLACGLSSETAARTLALAACIGEANWFCRIDQVADPRGNSRAESDGGAWVRTFTVQTLLSALGYEVGEIDGVAGPATQAARAAFSARTGVALPSAIDTTETWWLIMALGGQSLYFELIRRTAYATGLAQAGHLVHGWAAEPNPSPGFGTEVSGLKEIAMLRAWSVYLTQRDQPCTLPAEKAVPVFGSPDEMWQVVCREGTYEVLVYPDGGNLINSERGTSVQGGFD